jgi:prepilin-type N-terminal cleavage/methylation domain-containing protein
MKSQKGFTLIELMVVILIVGILAAVAIPIMRGRIDQAKWSEANSAAGSIRTAVRAYIAEKGPSHDYSDIEGTLDTQSVYENLGFSSSDLAGKYFDQKDYTIGSVAADPPSCVITVGPTAKDGGPPGTGKLDANGDWTVTTGP